MRKALRVPSLRALLGLVCGGVMLSDAEPARAFSAQEIFAEPSEEGGGAGRYFSGSPEDPFSCEVCHRGGDTPKVELEGLPERFVPGEHYDVRVGFAGDEASHALHLELMQEDGTHADLVLPEESEATRKARCDGLADSVPAFYVVDLGRRRVLGVQDCGASELTFSFTAPEVDRLYFALSVVRSDSSATATGDGTTQVRRVLRAESAASSGSGGCGVTSFPPSRQLSAGSAGYGFRLLALGGLLLCAWRRCRLFKLQADKRR